MRAVDEGALRLNIENVVAHGWVAQPEMADGSCFELDYGELNRNKLSGVPIQKATPDNPTLCGWRVGACLNPATLTS